MTDEQGCHMEKEQQKWVGYFLQNPLIKVLNLINEGL